MTSSSNSSLSLRPKLIIIHGLNNHRGAFLPLAQSLSELGFETHLIDLPGHGKNRTEAKTLEESMEVFHRTLEPFIRGTYFVIAFSHGALYFQLWLQKQRGPAPLKQVLLAPALAIHHQPLAEKLVALLPNYIPIKSVAPKKFRRYSFLWTWEYKILFAGMKSFREGHQGFRVPTLILIDPKDELVSSTTLKRLVSQEGSSATLELLERKFTKKEIGQHHVLFHPGHYSDGTWRGFIEKMSRFLRSV